MNFAKIDIFVTPPYATVCWWRQCRGSRNLGVPRVAGTSCVVRRGFQLIFIWCFPIWLIFIENNILLYGTWAGMTPEDSRICLKVILVLERPSKVYFGSKNWFSIFRNLQFSVFVQNSLFESQISRSIL